MTNIMDSKNRPDKQYNYFLRYFENNKFYYGLKALDLINEYHNGERRDGTQERSHLFEVLGFVISNFESRLDNNTFEKLIVVSALHDLVEDYPDKIKFKELKEMFPIDYVKSLKKVTKWEGFEKTKRDYDHYHGKIGKDFFATLTKANDRLHNLMSCERAFKTKRKEEYLKETIDYIIPNLKELRLQYSELYTPITTLLMNLKIQIKQLTYVIELEKKVNNLEAQIQNINAIDGPINIEPKSDDQISFKFNK